MDFLTVNETARLLRVSPITIRRYIAAGKLSAERVGRGVRVRRAAIEDFVTPIMVTAGKPESRTEEELPTMRETLGISIGIGRSGEPANSADHEDENLVEIYSPSSPDVSEFVPDELLGKPFTMDDPLWDIVGIEASDEPNDVASNKHKYLAEAILSEADDDELPTILESLGGIVGIGRSDGPTDVSANKYEYLAEAYESDKG